MGWVLSGLVTAIKERMMLQYDLYDNQLFHSDSSQSAARVLLLLDNIIV